MIDIHFIVLGAQKCATTWMYDALKQHPGIVMPTKKRESQYIGSTWFKEAGDGAYKTKYVEQQDACVVGDISVDYIYDAQSAAAVKKYAGNPKFMLCLRHPIDRALSAYAWLLRKGELDDRDVNATFERALAGNMEGPESELLARGFYDVQCQPYLEQFDPASFLVIEFSLIADRPERIYEAMLKHIGVDSTLQPDALKRAPKKNSHTEALLRIQRIAPDSRILGRLMDYAHQGVARMGLSTAAPALAPDRERQLQELYRPHVQRLDEILNTVPTEQKLVDGSFASAWDF